MKKVRKGTQLTLSNWKRAGRPAIHDKGIRHIAREIIKKSTSLHLTIKVRENKADIKNKQVLKILHYAIRRSRIKGLRIIHYTLEYNHIHLLVEAADKQTVHQGMQSFGITFAKKINAIKRLKGTVYKHRYHLRKINSPRELKNVLYYIFNNGIHHKRTSTVLDPYNTLPAFKSLKFLYGHWSNKIEADIKKSWFLSELKKELSFLLNEGQIHFKALEFV